MDEWARPHTWPGASLQGRGSRCPLLWMRERAQQGLVTHHWDTALQASRVSAHLGEAFTYSVCSRPSFQGCVNNKHPLEIETISLQGRDLAGLYRPFRNIRVP